MAVPPTHADRRAEADPRRRSKRVAAMREAVGEAIDIMVDCHARPSPAMGLQFAKALEPYGLYFFEEPCWPESVDGLAAINAAVTTPIATGERVTNLAAFRDLFAARACEICQLDITHCGGFTRSAAHRRPGRGASHRPGAAQSARAGQHRGLAGVRLLAAELHHLRDGPRRRAVAAGRGAGRLHRREEGPHRAAEHDGRAWASRSTRPK